MSESDVITQNAAVSAKVLLAMSIAPEEIGARLRDARKRRKLSQLDFAIEAGVSPATVYRWEKGKLPPMRELLRIGELLGLTSDQLTETDAELEVEREDRILEQVSGLREQIDRIEKLVQSLLVQSA